MGTLFFIFFHLIAVIFGFWLLLLSIPMHIFYSMNKRNANKISKNIQEQTEVLKNQKDERKSQNESQKTENSMADELSKLAQLKDSGVLTEEEFSSQKEKLLNK